MTDALEDHAGTISTGGRTITNLHFAGDINGLAGEGEKLAKLVEHTCNLPESTWLQSPKFPEPLILA